jgi:predicted HicB family RNase H-like nuclease
MKVLSLRIEDDGVHRRLVDEAKKAHRSLNGHINHLLTRHVSRVKVKRKEGER